MLLKSFNYSLIEDVQKTYLSATVSSGGATLTVKDITGFAVGDYIIIGEIGEESTELARLHTSTSPSGTTITLNANTAYSHGVDAPVYRIAFNQAEFSRSSTLTGTKSVLSTTAITPDREFTAYDDTSNSTGYGFVRWKNSSTSSYSSYSSGVNYEASGTYSSFDPRTLWRLRKRVRKLLDEDRSDSKVTDDHIRDSINDKQRDIAHIRLWSFYETEKSFIGVANQMAYDIPSTVQKIYNLSYNTQPLAPINYVRWKNLHWNSDTTSSNVSHFCVWNNQILLYPRPSNSSDTTTLNGAITSSDTMITVVSSSSFKRGDYYRFIIDNEVVYATGSTSTTFTGCLRGQEGTTASAHSNGATVSERDIVYTGHEEPTDLFETTDRTKIPEPEVLALGSACDLALLIGKETLHDRLLLRYKEAVVKLEEKYASKISSQFGRIKDRNEILSDYSFNLNPNYYPQDITGA